MATGPAMVCAKLKLMVSVLAKPGTSLPSVRPLTLLVIVRLVMGQSSVLLKLLPKDCTANVPLVSTVVGPWNCTRSPMRVTLLLLVVTNEPMRAPNEPSSE